MTVQPTQLRPYASFILGHLPEDRKGTSVGDLVDEVRQVLPFDEDPHLNPLGSPRFERWEDHDLDFGILLYEERRPPSWLLEGDELRDLLNHLLVVAKHGMLVAIYMSDGRRRNLLLQRLGSNGNGSGSSLLHLIHEERLNAAFVQGPTRTLWMSGIHAPVTSRADSKVLAGRNLRDALDPLGDQTFYFTAARSNVPGLLPVGVSPRKSRAWVGAARDWEQFRQITGSLLEHLARTTANTDHPLPVVAVPSHRSLDLREAFDIHLIPPELFAEDGGGDRQDQETLERWALRSVFRIVQTERNRLETEVELEGVILGKATLEVDASDPLHVVWTTMVEPATNPFEGGRPEHRRFEEDVQELGKILKRRPWLKIWFESGHTLSDGVLFEVRHRDLPFEDFTWQSFESYRVKQEKFWQNEIPENAIDEIGTRASLFCWVRNHWAQHPLRGEGEPGTEIWLACDDGAMEIADFIQLEFPPEGSTARPVLSLIHVKGAKDEKPTRGISVSAYEVVVGQAVKNLRYLDRLHLDATLRQGLDTKIGKLVWRDGTAVARTDMIAALDRLQASYRPRVVILQPQITRKKYEEIRKSGAAGRTGDKARLRQLDTLLLAARATANGLGAELMVVGDGTEAPDNDGG